MHPLPWNITPNKPDLAGSSWQGPERGKRSFGWFLLANSPILDHSPTNDLTSKSTTWTHFSYSQTGNTLRNTGWWPDTVRWLYSHAWLAILMKCLDGLGIVLGVLALFLGRLGETKCVKVQPQQVMIGLVSPNGTSVIWSKMQPFSVWNGYFSDLLRLDVLLVTKLRGNIHSLENQRPLRPSKISKLDVSFRLSHEFW